MTPDEVPAEFVEKAARAIWEYDTPAPELGWPHWDVAVERAANELWDLPQMVADTRAMARHALAAALPGAQEQAWDAGANVGAGAAVILGRAPKDLPERARGHNPHRAPILGSSS
ncbi:hypothetical protein [Promicromonospora sp. NPDC023805]|uniref:hypothetical protein n=1 Tax=Promicromonospora sp. NPDC023805 TaxID=3154696 RepID=UPI0033DD96D5